MEAKQQNQIERLRQALREVNANRDRFSTESYTQIVRLLLDQVRQIQTVTPEVTQKSDEIRLVTVMFVDVKDSTELAQQVDASDWKNLINEAHRVVANHVAQWDGQIGQYLGDGLLIFFGAQRSSGDDAIRAVSCALAVRSAMEHYANEVFLRYGIEFAIRIGLSTGRLVVGMIGTASKQELLALGPATNLAARLQSIAPTGQVLIDSTTYSRTRNQFIFEAQPPTRLKGYTEPVQFYLLVDRRTHSEIRLADTTLFGLTLPFVGREDILVQLNRLGRDITVYGDFHAVTLMGEIGIGKSRLLQEALQSLMNEPFKELIMVANYEKRGRSHNLLRSLLLQLCHLTEDTPIERMQAAVMETITTTWGHPDAPIAAEMIGAAAGFGFEDSPNVRRAPRDNAAFPWVVRWLRALAAGSRLLLIVDNLQWADTESVALLEYLVRELNDVGGLLLAAGQPSFRVDHPTYMQSFANHTLLLLDRLPPEATRVLIESVLQHVQRIPANLPQLINERAEGNPLFVQEFLGMLFDNGVFKPTGTDKQWRFDIIEYNDSMLPNGLIGVLQARLDDLDGSSKHVIQVAAIIGQVFWVGCLQDVIGRFVSTELHALTVRGLISASSESVFEDEAQYAFRHTMYRDVAYEMLPRPKREAYHLRVAEWFIMRVQRRPELYSTLAEHLELGGKHDAALLIYLEASQVRLEKGMLSEALDLTDKGLALGGKMPRDVALPSVSQLWALRGQVLNELNRFDEASAACDSALRLLKELPDDQLQTIRVQAARTLGVAYRNVGRYDDALEALMEAHDYLPDETSDTPLTAAVLRSFGVLCLYRGNLNESLAYQERAYTFAQLTGQEAQITGSMNQLGLIALERGDLAKSLSYFERVLEINEKREYTYYQLADLRNIGLVYMHLLNYERALAVFDGALTLRGNLGMHDALLDAYIGLCLIEIQKAESGMNRLQTALRQPQQDTYTAELVQLALLEGLVKTEQYAEALDLATTLQTKLKKQNPISYGRAMLYAGIAQIELGQREAAYTTLQAALHMEQEYAGRDVWVIELSLARASANPERVQAHYSQVARRLRAISASLFGHLDLQNEFLNSPTVREVLSMGGLR